MKPDVVAFLCDPTTHEPLELKTGPAARGHSQEFLFNSNTGERFPIREHIPIFLNATDVSGSNKKYKKTYDRLARFYDFSTWL
jgi:uncharacterized protein YbaR (Trm112 family)